MQSFTPILLIALSFTGLCRATVTGSPVEKVVKLLEDMKEKMTADGKGEEAVYDKYSCWCTGMTRTKGKAIEEAKEELESLGADIMRLSGKIATLSSEVDTAAQDMKDNHEAQQKATAIREKENAAFTALRAELGQALQSLNQALEMLNMAPQLLQTSQALSTESADKLRSAINAIPDKALGSLPAASLVQLQHIGTALAQGKYDPSYGSIVGILEEMYKTLSKDLEKETDTEGTAYNEYEDLMKTKVEALEELQDQANKKMGEKAKAAKDMADATTNYDDTNAQMEADITFFNDAVDSCTDKAKEWTTRKEMRTEEMDGIDEALKILTSDASRELFAKSINAAARSGARPNMFLQVAATPSTPSGQEQAYKALKTVAKRSQSVVLAKIAAQVKLAQGGHFDEVMKAIDDVIGVLKTEQEEDNDKKTQCNDEYQNVAKTVAKEEWSIEKNVAEIDKLETTIANKEQMKAETIDAIEDTAQRIKDMKKQRDDEEQAYDNAKKDDEDAVKVLNQAKDALQKFYKAHGLDEALTELMQGEPKFDRGDAAPDAKFSDKGSRTGQTKGITLLLDNILEGLADEIAHQTIIEKAAIADWKKADGAAKKLKELLEKKRDNLKKEIADRNKDKDDEEKDKEANEKDLKEEQDYKAKIKPDCDFMLKNWQGRYNARKAEMDGLVTAKDFLAGAMGGGAALVAQKTNLRHVAPH